MIHYTTNKYLQAYKLFHICKIETGKIATMHAFEMLNFILIRSPACDDYLRCAPGKLYSVRYTSKRIYPAFQHVLSIGISAKFCEIMFIRGKTDDMYYHF